MGNYRPRQKRFDPDRLLKVKRRTGRQYHLFTIYRGGVKYFPASWPEEWKREARRPRLRSTREGPDGGRGSLGRWQTFNSESELLASIVKDYRQLAYGITIGPEYLLVYGKTFAEQDLKGLRARLVLAFQDVERELKKLGLL